MVQFSGSTSEQVAVTFQGRSCSFWRENLKHRPLENSKPGGTIKIDMRGLKTWVEEMNARISKDNLLIAIGISLPLLVILLFVLASKYPPAKPGALIL